MTPQLRYYQLDVIDRGRGRIRSGVRRLLIQGATGSGKTHVSSEIVRSAYERGKRVLFLAHRRRLISQKAERLRLFGVPHGIVMRGEGSNREAPVQVASRDTLLSRALRHDWIAPPPADLVITDECHNALSEEYQRLLALYPRAVHVGLTATPARSDGKGLGDFYEAMECTVPTSQLVKEGWLVPVRCYAPEYAVKGKRTQNKLAGDPVAQWKVYGEGRPTVLFAARVEASLAACAAFNAASIPAEHVDSHTPDDRREAIVERLRAGFTRVICNVGVWTEGVDIPELSCCILLRMAGSYVLFAQAVGRIMRPCPGKTDAVLIDHAGAVLKHGFPDEDVEWSLSKGDTVDRRNKEALKEGKRSQPVCCPKCAYLFSGTATCPACGYLLSRRQRNQDTRGEVLVEVPRERSEAQLAEERVRYWHKCLFTAAGKRQSVGMAARMFRGRYPEGPTPDLPNFPAGNQWGMKVADLFPQYLRKKGGC